MTKIAILRCEKLPSFITWDIPNLEELFEEDQVLVRGFIEQGLLASSVIWSDPNIDWNQFDLALIRSTWDYLDASEHFLHVLANIESSSCRLFNPLSAIRWNMDKRYLFDLERQGVPIIPTYLASQIESGTLRALFDEHQWQSVILKPTVGLAGSDIHRVPLQRLEDTLADLKANQPLSEFLIQPFIENIITEGEWSFIYFNRDLSHVLLKKPAANDYRVQGIYGGTIQPAEPPLRDLRQAEAVLDKLPLDLLYSRLDLVRVNGQMAVMEVELIEPIFSFRLVPESIGRLVHATKLRLRIHQ